MILAGISISALTNQRLFTQAQNAKNLTEEKTAEENEILTNYVKQMNAILGGQVTESIPDGATVTPINDITTWLKTGGISKQYSYTTIEQVIADSTCTQNLMKNENAIKYLARSIEFANAICASETAMTYLGQSEYVDDTVLNSDIWTQKICDSVYWNEVLIGLVPIMTSDTTPSGECFASSNYKPSYYAFNGTNGGVMDCWHSYNETGYVYVGYDFVEKTAIKKIYLENRVYNNNEENHNATTFKIQASTYSCFL